MVDALNGLFGEKAQKEVLKSPRVTKGGTERARLNCGLCV